MKKRNQLSDTPRILGTGLVALDVVTTDGSPQPTRYWAGGTCGNVLLALRYLGWESAPICRFRKGPAATRLLDDLGQWGVSTEFITFDETGSTPVIVQRIRRTTSGEPYHTFSWRCPNCGTRLPGYKPVLTDTAQELAAQLGTPQVFFFDRLSRGALHLARSCRHRGAVVVFEPSSVGNPALFREAWDLAHIVKYSHERLQELPPKLETSAIRLQIETLGEDGLRYRSRLPGCKTTTWQRLSALSAEEVKDTSGAGDWCSAGIIHRLAQNGASGLKTVTDTSLKGAIRYGQALAAWNCAFEGARSGMYSVEKDVFERQVNQILSGRDSKHIAGGAERLTLPNPLDCLCPSCERDAESTRRVSRNGRTVTAARHGRLGGASSPPSS